MSTLFMPKSRGREIRAVRTVVPSNPAKIGPIQRFDISAPLERLRRSCSQMREVMSRGAAFSRREAAGTLLMQNLPRMSSHRENP
jgi:hypothetical protein